MKEAEQLLKEIDEFDAQGLEGVAEVLGRCATVIRELLECVHELDRKSRQNYMAYEHLERVLSVSKFDATAVSMVKAYENGRLDGYAKAKKEEKWRNEQ